MRHISYSSLFVLRSVFCFALVAASSFASVAIDVAALALGDSGDGWSFDGTNLVLSSQKQYVAHGTRTLMTIRADADCTLVASNLSVSAEGLTTAGLDCNYHNVNLLLWSDDNFKNTFVGGTACAGIAVVTNTTSQIGASITISNLNETAALTVNGGTPITSSGAAGIGGGNRQRGGTIIIRGGIINATAGPNSGNCGGAGIGGGYRFGATDIIISGGSVTATAAKEGAGIGGGRDGSNSYIEISGGTVIAKGHSSGSGIGGGYNGSGGTIVISGGTVTATSGSSAGIAAGGSIRISGGTVTASGAKFGIGGSSGSITISGGKVTATGNTDNESTGIGGPKVALSISGGTIKATGKYQGIGRTSSGTAGTVTITGGSILQSPILDTPIPLPTDGNNQVYELTIPGFTPNSVAQITGLPNGYGLNDVYADANGQIYVYLPNGSGTFNVEGTDYRYYIEDLAATAFLASETFDITFLNANPDKGTLSTEGGTYPGATRVTVVATPLSEASVFDKWTGTLPEGVDARSPEISFMTGEGDYTLTAHFVDPLYVNGRSVAYGSGDGWTYDSAMLTLSSAGPFVIHGTSTYSRILVEADCTIIASNLYVSAQELTYPALDCNFHDVALALCSDAPYQNTFYGGINKPGIAVVSTNIALAECGAKLTISALNDDAALYVKGGPYSSVNTSSVAGIGSEVGQHAGTIDIQGGNIIVSAGTQSGNAGGSGIGGGYRGSYHAISISGGIVDATAGRGGAAIGTGRAGAKGGIIAISGGKITTTVDGSALSIGGGYQSSGGTIQISGGTVSAPAGIGGPNSGAVYTITGGSISQKDVNKPAPTDGSESVYRVTTTVLDGTTPVKNTKVAVRGPGDYGVKDIYTDASGKLYFYLPNGVSRFYVGDQRYKCTVTSAATTAELTRERPAILMVR